MTTEQRKREIENYAAVHALMLWQRTERRATGRPLRTGDLVQAHVGGDIRLVDEHEDADHFIARKAAAAGAERRLYRGSSAAGRCAIYGGRTKE